MIGIFPFSENLPRYFRRSPLVAVLGGLRTVINVMKLMNAVSVRDRQWYLVFHVSHVEIVVH